jgi:hypothetical protein
VPGRLNSESAGEVRLEPTNHRFLAVCILLFTLIFEGFAFYVGAAADAFIVGICIIGGLAGTGCAIFVVWASRYQRKLGPYLRFDGKSIFLRNGQSIDVPDIISFRVTQKVEPAFDEIVKMSHLVLERRSGPEIDILKSFSFKRIDVLKNKLNALIARSTP